MNIFFLNMGQQRQANVRRCFFFCAALVAGSSMGACTTLQTTPSAQSATPADEKILAQTFSLNGRISVRVGDKLDSGQIQWRRTLDGERIGLYSPLGSQVAELLIDKRANIVTLRQGTETSTAASISELTQSMLGAPIDLDLLNAWVQGVGLIENQATDVTLANGDKWRVTAERFNVAGAGGNYRFASRVTATRGDVMVRLVIDEWTPQ